MSNCVISEKGILCSIQYNSFRGRSEGTQKEELLGRVWRRASLALHVLVCTRRGLTSPRSSVTRKNKERSQKIKTGWIELINQELASYRFISQNSQLLNLIKSKI